MEEETNLKEAHKLSSFNGTMHYSFDYARTSPLSKERYATWANLFQDPLQVWNFSINVRALPCQVSYLIDKAATVCKGANATISYLHHFFSHYGLGETQTFIYKLTIVRDKIKTLTFYGI